MNTRTRITLILFSVLMYALLFSGIGNMFGKGMAVSAVMPVVAVGWLFGLLPGICAALLSFPINIFMYELLGLNGWEEMVGRGGGVIGTFTLILVGGVIGYVRNINTQLKKELDERRQIEIDLKRHRDQLDELIKQKTAELQESNNGLKATRDHLNNIIESSLDSIVLTDNKGYVTKANKSFLELLGYTEDNQVVGKHMAEFSPMEAGAYESAAAELVDIDQAFLDNIVEPMSRLSKTGKISNMEFYLIRTDRKVIPVEENIVNLYDKQGERTGTAGIIRDISERKKFEETLKQSEEKYQNLIENANDAIVSINKEGIIVTLNKKAEEMYGYTREELLGNSVLLLVPPHRREDQKKALGRLGTITNEGTFRRTIETIAFGKDGREFPVETSMFGLKIHGECILTSFIRDISERKKMEQQLLQSEKLKSLGELSAGVAHDFNNVLAAILGRAQLLKMNFEPPAGIEEKRKSVLALREGLEVIERAAKDGAETVRRIQEFARRRDDDKFFKAIDVNEIIENAVEFTKVRWKHDAESKAIKYNIIKEISPLHSVKGSAAELREVFTNLINNALDAMPRGGAITIKTCEQEGNTVVQFSDTGCGISSSHKDRIFDPFFTTKGVQSTGLGLSVSYGIVNRHHGTITVDSVEGEGTTFTLNFPVIKGKDTGDSKEDKVIPIQGKQKKARILVIEDEKDVRELLRDILTDAGHEVEITHNGSEGIEIFMKERYDLVFTDLGMPVMSGWQVAERVKSINRSVPVAIITGWNTELSESEMKDKLIDFIIHKPFEVNQILRLVEVGIERFKAA